MTENTEDTATESPEDVAAESGTSTGSTMVDTNVVDDDQAEEESDTFPRQVVEDLRQENGRYRQRAQRADDLAKRLHTELVRATGRLADPTDLTFDEAHLDDQEALTAAINDLLDRKPHLATRRPSGDIGQGNRGGSSEPVSLLQMLKDRT